MLSTVSGNARAAGHDKLMSSFVQILEGSKAIEEGRATIFRGTNVWVEKWFVEEVAKHPCTSESKARMRRIFRRFQDLVQEQKPAFRTGDPHNKAQVAPVEFIGVACMIDQYFDRSNDDLGRAIHAMKRDVRAVHPGEVKRNQTVWHTLWSSIERSLGRNGSGQMMGVPPDVMIDDSEDEGEDSQRPALQGFLSGVEDFLPGSKRKRAAQDDGIYGQGRAVPQRPI